MQFVVVCRYVKYTEFDNHPGLNVRICVRNTNDIPVFFKCLVEVDLKHSTNNSRKFVTITEQIMLLFCMIDGTIEKNERSVINKYIQDLTTECDLNEVKEMEAVTTSSSAVKLKNSTTKDESSVVKQEDNKKPEDESKPLKTIDDLNKLIGLKGAKEEVKNAIDLVNFQRNREKMGLPSIDSSRHLVFIGNPGTGKTTVARILADIYKANGVLSSGQMIETAREDLVAGYVGQTAIKTREILEKALGGILFVDEAYTLSEGGENDFGQEAINTLLKYMEDHRDELIVIAAGYEDEMKTFIESNPGLRSRFTTYIHFEDYTVDELYQIFKLMCDSAELNYDESFEPKIKEKFRKKKEDAGKYFGNGREVRNYLREVFQNIANGNTTISLVWKR